MLRREAIRRLVEIGLKTKRTTAAAEAIALGLAIAIGALRLRLGHRQGVL
jgi:hypothetical protein